MQALVLVGGEGTRMRPLTLTRPKPALPLVDRPFIRYIVDWLAGYGVTEVVMSCGFGAGPLREALGEDDGVHGPSIRYVEEPEPLGTAGPLRLADDQGGLGDRFLVVNGDLLADFDLGALIRGHEQRGAVATLALYAAEDPSSYGLVRRAGGPAAPGESPASAEGEVLAFLEKPDPGQIDTDEINAGAYVLEHSVIDLIPPRTMVSIEREVFPRLVGQGLYGHRLDGYWMDIGTPERYLQASWDILEGRVHTAVGARLDGAGLLLEDGVQVDPAASVNPPALLETGVAIGPGAAIGARAVIGHRSEIGERATVSSSVVLSDCRIGPEASLHDAILAPGVEVGEGARIESGAVIGEGARIEAGVAIADGTRLGPGEVAS
jgi:mannose-1-phosphate guanylyltransferase